MTSPDSIHYAVIGFILLQFIIGIWVGRKTKNVDDYLVAGRRLGLPLVFLSVFATWFGAESCISSSGSAYRHGLSWNSPEPFGYGLTLILMGTVFAAGLWRLKLTTLADLFRNRFSPFTEKAAVLMMAPTSLLWASAQILAFGQILSAAFGFNLSHAILLATTVVISYTLIGGLLADVWTDAVQGIILILGLLVMFLSLVYHHGSSLATQWSQALTPNTHPSSPPIPWLNLLEVWTIPVCGSVVAQELISRISASRTSKIASRSAQLAGGFYILIGFIPLSIGLLGRSLVPDLEESDQVITHIAKNFLPPFLYVLFAGALVSVILSTVDSALLAAGSLVSQNLISPLVGPLSARSELLLARGTVVIFGLLSCFLAFRGDSVYDLVEEASAFGSSGIFVLMVFGLFTRWGGSAAALTALASGLIVYLAGAYWLEWETPYLSSLGSAFASYLLVACFEAYQASKRVPPC